MTIDKFIPTEHNGTPIRKHDIEYNGKKIWLHPFYTSFGIDENYNLYRFKKDHYLPKKWNFRKIDGRYSIYFTNIRKKYFSKARFIYEAVYNVEIKAGYVVDHINNKSTDDCIENYQILASSDNNKKCVFKFITTKNKHIYKDVERNNFCLKMKFFIKDLATIEDGKKMREEILEILKKYDKIEIV